MLRANECPKLKVWLGKKRTNKYTSPDIQNEVLKVMVLRDIIYHIKKAPFFSIMVDETTDNYIK